MKARIMMIIMAVALVALPTMAQQEWQSTSAMQGSGSSYSPQVTDVGAADVDDMATTTESYSPAKAPDRPKRSDFGPGQDGGYQDPNSPIGDAWPMAIFAVMFAIIIAIKKTKKTTMMKKNIKAILFLAALMIGNSAWADATMPKGTYYFDFSAFTDKVFEIHVFNNIDNVSYISFSSLDACNSSVSQRSSDHHIYENFTDGFTYLKLEISTSFVKGSGFIEIRHGLVNGSTTKSGWYDYKAPTAIGGEEVYVCKVTPSDDFTWGTTSSDIPDCSAVAPSNPTLQIAAGANGSLGACTAGGTAIGASSEVAAGTTVHLIATPDDGYSFFGWVRPDGSVQSTLADYVFSMPSSSLSLTATFYSDSTDPAISGCDGCFRIAP